mmetsp:Transcript_27837/g.74999  ORF Transcript_27837/g.74999 Transcript_27837/m.74999 type:complete len:237 (+) Transcript_27837:72-782(+)
MLEVACWLARAMQRAMATPPTASPGRSWRLVLIAVALIATCACAVGVDVGQAGGEEMAVAQAVLLDSGAPAEATVQVLIEELGLPADAAARATALASEHGAVAVGQGPADAVTQLVERLRARGLNAEMRAAAAGGRDGGAGTAGPPAHAVVLLLDDDHNSPDSVAAALAAILGYGNEDAAAAIASVEARGAAAVLRAPRAVCVTAAERLSSAGLTVDVRADGPREELRARLSMDVL